MTPLYRPEEGAEVDLIHPTWSWSVRLTRDRRTGQVAVIVVDHAEGRPVVAGVLRPAEAAR